MRSKLLTKVLASFVGLIALVMFTSIPAEAKKMGSGNSVGKQSNTVTKNQSSLPAKPDAAPVNSAGAAKPAAPAAAPAAPAAQPSRFGGMGGILGGIAAGIGLSYLFSHMGLGGLGDGIASMVSGLLMFGLLALVGLWLYKRFANKAQGGLGMTPAPAGMSSSSSSQSAWETQSAPPQHAIQNTAVESHTAASNPSSLGIGSQVGGVPPISSPIQAQLMPGSWADQESFLHNAKSLFLQLQEASDNQNIDVLKEYTTPELFNHLRQDMLGRQTATSYTQVLTLAADLIAVEEENQEYLASVRFSGSIREEKDGPAADFQEVWNWFKPVNGQTGWLLCGIQQLN
jgi:predicted lipid-binding transport protein (Tim44 family)